MALKDIFKMTKANRYTADGREELIKAQEAVTEDRRYNIGEISEKTGLQKTANGWVKPKGGAERNHGTEQKKRGPGAIHTPGKGNVGMDKMKEAAEKGLKGQELKEFMTGSKSESKPTAEKQKTEKGPSIPKPSADDLDWAKGVASRNNVNPNDLIKNGKALKPGVKVSFNTPRDGDLKGEIVDIAGYDGKAFVTVSTPKGNRMMSTEKITEVNYEGPGSKPAESTSSAPKTEKKSTLKLPDEKSSFSTDVNRMKKLKKEDYKQYTIQLEKLHSKYPINKWKDLYNKTLNDEAPRILTGDTRIRVRK